MQRDIFSVPAARQHDLSVDIRLEAARREMRGRHAHDLDVRMETLRYALDIPAPPEATLGKSGTGWTIWQYWGQGIDFAPQIVRTCFASVARHASDRKIVILNDDTLDKYVEMPEAYIRNRSNMSHTHFSDLLRVELLHRHGGIWIDATVLMTGPIPDVAEQADFFCFTRPCDPYLLSSWFMKADPQHPVVLAWRHMLRDYWSRNDSLLNYFLLHYLFEAAVTLHQDIREHWLRSPVLSSETCHLLQHNLPNHFDARQMASIQNQTPIHKLTYRLPEPAGPAPTFLDHLLADERCA